jgi:hypothetical protein
LRGLARAGDADLSRRARHAALAAIGRVRGGVDACGHAARARRRPRGRPQLSPPAPAARGRPRDWRCPPASSPPTSAAGPPHASPASGTQPPVPL